MSAAAAAAGAPTIASAPRRRSPGSVMTVSVCGRPPQRPTLTLCGPAREADDPQQQHAVEWPVAVLRVALGQPGGERGLPAGVAALEAQHRLHPPEPRPVVALP